jgi:hypothetical protein
VQVLHGRSDVGLGEETVDVVGHSRKGGMMEGRWKRLPHTPGASSVITWRLKRGGPAALHPLAVPAGVLQNRPWSAGSP